jgi:hypothetical protein
VIAPLSKCRDERSEFYGSKEGQGRFKTTLPIAACQLSVEKNKNWIPVCAGMIGE